ncbi:peptidoglycan D,D-transpeptidase FtsI family protein [Thermohalobacter berrensis]|uniref:Penicillin-binding protein transpeptidase domain-containing protein n=1 Tax=Thermohalobacter berrensis TaxID=99594 RepID=A0A419TAW4_9FIRM|nr:penicillin-binding transpeptidase domain-containing protein [Thermohalobacter berrensis]RKD34601.1 hypothetical protein BET03_01890 [Thermohalobacter berrensis]
MKNKKIEKRLLNLAFLSFFIFILLVIRIFWIQIIKHQEYTNAAMNQRIMKVNFYPSRGLIYDKNLIPLTNFERVPTLYIFKNLATMDKKFYNYINELSGYSHKEIEEIIKSSKGIIEIPVRNNNGEVDKRPKGVFLTDKVIRYSHKNILSHVIGYIQKSNNTGKYGIEGAYDDILKIDNSKALSVTIDGSKRIIPGIGYTYAESAKKVNANSIKLTIDYHIQKAVEDIIDKENKRGAVIVANVKNGDIVAMVSRPNMDQRNIQKYLDSNRMELYNRAIQISYPPGSLFKIVVLLAALENDLVSMDEKFVCKGYEQLGSIKIACHSYEDGGHGELDIREAFYESCNSVFIQLGKRVGAKKVIDMAKRLGFGNIIDIGLKEEVKGRLPKGNEMLGPAIGNISIGQGKIEATPLQITNMMLTIANNGIKKDLSIVEGIVTEEGHMVKRIERDNERRVIPVLDSLIVRDFMEDVVTKGTAKNISLEGIGGAAGKTGSAQALLNKKETIHGWFSGYFPKKNPRYVITVFIEEGLSGGKSAAPIFEKIAREIYKLGR